MAKLFGSRFLLLILVLILSSSLGDCVFGAENGYDTYTDKDGRKMSARILSVKGDKVEVERWDGKIFTFALETLSPEDQKRVRKMDLSIPKAGQENTDNGDSQFLLASKEQGLGNHSEAAKLAEECLKLREAHYGPAAVETILSRNLLGDIRFSQGSYPEALTLFEQALEAADASDGFDEKLIATLAANAGVTNKILGNFEKAEPLLVRTREIRIKQFGEQSLPVAQTNFLLASLSSATGDYERAEHQMKQAMDVRLALLAPDDLSIAELHSGFGGLFAVTGRHEEAEASFRKSLEIFEKKGPESVQTAIALSRLGGFLRGRHRHPEAIPLLERAVEVNKKVFGPNHTQVAEAMNLLAMTYMGAGRGADAEPLLKESLRIREAVVGSDHPLVANALHNLAAFHLGEDNEEAERLMKRAILIDEGVYGPESVEVAGHLKYLAGIYSRMERNEEAKELYFQSLAIYEANHKDGDPVSEELVGAWFGQGGVYLDEGKLKLADEMFEKAGNAVLEDPGLIRPLWFRSYLVAILKTKFDLGETEIDEKWIRGAIRTQKRAASWWLSLGSETDRYFMSLMNGPNPFVYEYGSGEMIAETLLCSKGLVLDSILEDRRVTRSSDDPEIAELAKNITATRELLRNFELEGVGESVSTTIKENLNALEREMSLTISGFGFSRRALEVTVDDLQKALPEGAVLIDFVRYDRFVRGTKEQKSLIGAVVIQPKVAPAFISLGSQKEIAGQIDGFLETIESIEDEPRVMAAGQAIFNSLIRPLEPNMGENRKLIICPDAEINVVPFAALLDPEGRFLSETYDVRYISAARDLLSDTVKQSPQTPGAAVLVGNPNFGHTESIEPATEANTTESVSITENLRSAVSEEILRVEFNPLPATSEELNRIETALGDDFVKECIRLEGDKAVESLLRDLEAPRILHLATHGFFLEDVPYEEETEKEESDSKNEENETSEEKSGNHALSKNPMYRSGIALSGAQNTFDRWKEGLFSQPESDGILMAAEVVDLNLTGTELVTLSACSTARGAVWSGEGVFGMRRGLSIAGSQNMLLTLWDIADEPTVNFMGEFYEAFRSTGDASLALSITQRKWLVDLRQEKGLATAIYLAGPFVMSSRTIGRDPN